MSVSVKASDIVKNFPSLDFELGLSVQTGPWPSLMTRKYLSVVAMIICQVYTLELIFLLLQYLLYQCPSLLEMV